MFCACSVLVFFYVNLYLFHTCQKNIIQTSMCSISLFYFHFIVKPVESACFPAMAKVKLENGKIVTMSKLQKEDKVQIGNTRDQ